MKPYLRACKTMSLEEANMRRTKLSLAAAPKTHPIRRGFCWVTKARFARPDRGKSAGGRVIYYVTVAPHILFLLTPYPGNEQDDLINDQPKAIRAAIEGIEGDTR